MKDNERGCEVKQGRMIYREARKEDLMRNKEGGCETRKEDVKSDKYEECAVKKGRRA